MKLAIFPNDEGTISVLVPAAPNCGLTLKQICTKDVLKSISCENT